MLKGKYFEASHVFMHRIYWAMRSLGGGRDCGVAGLIASCQIKGEGWLLESAGRLLPWSCGFLSSGSYYAIWIEIFSLGAYGTASRSGGKSLCMFQQTNKLPMEMHLGIFLSNWISAVVSVYVPPGCGGKRTPLKCFEMFSGTYRMCLLLKSETCKSERY